MLDSTATITDIENELKDTVSYSALGNSSLCQRFIVAARMLLFMRPQMSKRDMGDRTSHEIRWDLTALRKELEKAETWIAVNDPSNAVKHPDFSESRDFGAKAPISMNPRSYGTDYSSI